MRVPHQPHWRLLMHVEVFAAIFSVPLFVWANHAVMASVSRTQFWSWAASVAPQVGAAIILVALLAVAKSGDLLPAPWTKPTWRDLGWALVGLAIGWVVIPLLQVVSDIFAPTGSSSPAASALKGPSGLATIVVTGAIYAVCTEVVYRWFLVSRLEQFGLNRWLSGAVSLAGFSIPFFLSGISSGLSVGIGWGAAITGLYLWRRNLIACIVMDFLNFVLTFTILQPLLAR